jgi:hypothetical protein
VLFCHTDYRERYCYEIPQQQLSLLFKMFLPDWGRLRSPDHASKQEFTWRENILVSAMAALRLAETLTICLFGRTFRLPDPCGTPNGTLWKRHLGA